MKIGLHPVGAGTNSDPEGLKTLAVHCERLGFNTLWAPEHIAFKAGAVSQYPYGGSPDPTTAMLNPFVTLTYAAAFTRSLRLATGICLVPEYNPVLLAKLVASVDHLSGGRFALGLGVGWQAEEFEVMGIPWARRTQRTADYIAAMRKIWGESPASYRGEFVRFEGLISNPRPVSGAAVPILIGGESDPALSRVARYGSGWYGFNLTPEQTAERLTHLRGLLDQRGRKLAEIDIVIRPPRTPSPEEIKRYAALGVRELVAVGTAKSSSAETIGLLESLAERWVKPAAAA